MLPAEVTYHCHYRQRCQCKHEYTAAVSQEREHEWGSLIPGDALIFHRWKSAAENRIAIGVPFDEQAELFTARIFPKAGRDFTPCDVGGVEYSGSIQHQHPAGNQGTVLL